jgi:hypothetical protein
MKPIINEFKLLKNSISYKLILFSLNLSLLNLNASKKSILFSLLFYVASTPSAAAVSNLHMVLDE